MKAFRIIIFILLLTAQTGGLWGHHVSNEEMIELELRFFFPTEDMLEQDIYIGQAGFLHIDDDGLLYVTDMRRHQVHIFDLTGKPVKQLGRKGQGPGDFNYPSGVMTFKDRMIVKEDSRLQFFDKTWKSVGTAALPGRYKSIVVGPDGRFFASIFMFPSDQQNLITVLSQDMTILNEFGEIYKLEPRGTLANYLSIDMDADGNLLAAFAFFPVIRRYSTGGELLAKIRINNKQITEMEKFNLKSFTSPPSKDGRGIRLNEIILSIKAADKGFYIMTFASRLEITRYDEAGHRAETYWIAREKEYNPNDFAVVNKDNELIFYITQGLHDRVDVYGIKK